MLPVLAITAWSGTGKTTLLKQLIPALKEQNIRPALIKHTHHNVDIDVPGKDSYELRKAGADQVVIYNANRWALITETHGEESDIFALVDSLNHALIDLVLLEGFKHEKVPKIVVWREALGRDLAPLLDENVIAIVSDNKVNADLPWLDLNDLTLIAEFIREWLEQQKYSSAK